ncbi:MAG: hypothetical protein BYD32DRAFT_449481 [Podila humilis]|nr:MAG: hypothetical protein BYD32DRAFT_449481 [Podila humilis]
MRYRSPYIATQRPHPLFLQDRLWKRVFKRLHAKERYPNEKDFLYKLYHYSIWSDGLKHVIGWTARRRALAEAAAPPPPPQEEALPDIDVQVEDQIEPEPEDENDGPTEEPPAIDQVPIGDQVHPDARCAICKPYQFASTSHNLWFCPPVKAAWEQMLTWIRTLFPHKYSAQFLTAVPHEIQLCWPSYIPDLHPLVIHLHSLTSNAIWRNYCRISDLAREGADITEETQLVDILKVALRFRAKVEHQRALYKDKMRLENHTSGRRRIRDGGDDDAHYNEMEAIWHQPPHITVSKDGIVFGPTLGMAPDPPNDPDDQEQGPVDPATGAEPPVPEPDAGLEAVFKAVAALGYSSD